MGKRSMEGKKSSKFFGGRRRDVEKIQSIMQSDSKGEKSIEPPKRLEKGGKQRPLLLTE